MSNPFANWTAEMVKAHNAKHDPNRKAPLPAMMKALTDIEALPQGKPVFAPSATTDEAKLNKTEQAFLRFIRADPKIKEVHVQDMTFKLANDCRLTPDFSYIFQGRQVFIDVKGFQREDALIKMKMAARKFPQFDFYIVFKAQGGWSFNKVKP